MKFFEEKEQGEFHQGQINKSNELNLSSEIFNPLDRFFFFV